MKIGDRIRVPKGNDYTVHKLMAFRRSDGTVRGTVYAIQGQRVYFRLAAPDEDTGATNADTLWDCLTFDCSCGLCG